LGKLKKEIKRKYEKKYRKIKRKRYKLKLKERKRANLALGSKRLRKYALYVPLVPDAPPELWSNPSVVILYGYIITAGKRKRKGPKPRIRLSIKRVCDELNLKRGRLLGYLKKLHQFGYIKFTYLKTRGEYKIKLTTPIPRHYIGISKSELGEIVKNKRKIYRLAVKTIIRFVPNKLKSTARGSETWIKLITNNFIRKYIPISRTTIWRILKELKAQGDELDFVYGAFNEDIYKYKHRVWGMRYILRVLKFPGQNVRFDQVETQISPPRGTGKVPSFCTDETKNSKFSKNDNFVFKGYCDFGLDDLPAEKLDNLPIEKPGDLPAEKLDDLPIEDLVNLPVKESDDLSVEKADNLLVNGGSYSFGNVLFTNRRVRDLLYMSCGIEGRRYFDRARRVYYRAGRKWGYLFRKRGRRGKNRVYVFVDDRRIELWLSNYGRDLVLWMMASGAIKEQKRGRYSLEELNYRLFS